MNKQEQLFLSLVRPHQLVSVATISRWMRDLMTKSGIDTERFKGHSVRGAVTSKARHTGLSVTQVLEKANWSAAKTFHKFYYREIENDKFQEKVLKI